MPTRDYASRAKPGAAFSGIVAREFFADGLLVIDYPRRTLSFSRKLALSPAAPGSLAYERAFRVPIAIGELQVEGNLDTGANVDIGYLPGPMPWLVGEKLRELGVEILNTDITGQCHQDRRLITGDSPLASNNIGKLAAEALLQEARA